MAGKEWFGMAGNRDRWHAWSAWVWLRIGTGGWRGVVWSA